MKLLFLCPHNAAKSVLAAAYAQKLAKTKGLGLEIDTAGTEPSEQVSPAVTAFLQSQGMTVSHVPRKVILEDIRSADQVVSMGCNIHELPVLPNKLERWDEITPVSQNREATWQQIRLKVEALFQKL
jgi:arsenate reductase